MKLLKNIGKLLVVIGVLHLYQKNTGFYGFGGYVDYSWAIILISFLLIIIGLALVYFANKAIKKS